MIKQHVKIGDTTIILETIPAGYKSDLYREWQKDYKDMQFLNFVQDIKRLNVILENGKPYFNKNMEMIGIRLKWVIL